MARPALQVVFLNEISQKIMYKKCQNRPTFEKALLTLMTFADIIDIKL